MDKTICELFIGTFFFAMPSCEYLKVLADSVSITFEQQKRDSKNDVITQHRSGDKLLCPVKIWCKIIRHLLSYSSSNQDTPVNTFILPNGKPHHFTGSEVLKTSLYRSRSNWIRHPGIHSRSNWTTFSKEWSCNGNVLSRHPCVYNNAIRTVV
jgi:hypothetical protein